MKTILHLCADIGSDSKPYKDAGYNVICIGKKIGVENYNPPTNIYGIIANPPCTEFSTARLGGKARNNEAGMFLVNECLRIIKQANPVFWVVENPATGILKNYLGKPDFVYEPWEFGSPWTKKTALWGIFNAPPKLFSKWEEVEKNPFLYQRPNRKKLSFAFLHKSAIKHIQEFKDFTVEDDASFRSLCSQKFAQEFFKCNK